MAAMDIDAFRKLLAERIEVFSKAHPPGEIVLPGLSDTWNGEHNVPPPQIIESMVNVESSFDPSLVDPHSGAVGLGQITVDGMEWGVFKQDHPDVPSSKLTDPATNLDVMIEGMSYRQAQGGAWEDWYLAAGGYLGGLTRDGTDNGADAYGTTWRDYVRRMRLYIVANFGNTVASQIDQLEPGSATVGEGTWEDGDITYNPDAPAGDKTTGTLAGLITSYRKAAGQKSLTDKATGAVSSAAQEVAGAVWGMIGGFVTLWAPRAGLALAGVLLAGIGAAVLLR